MTNIGLDHTEYLGNTLEEIAATKAEILKANGRAVVYRSTPSVEQMIERVCKERNIELTFPQFDEIQLKNHSLEGQVFDYKERKDVVLPLLVIVKVGKR